MPALIYIVIAIVIGGGASVAAENSLPGDFLYGMKTGVNERVMGAFSAGTEAKANFEAKVAIKRLTEMERLAVRGKVDADVGTRLEENFAAFADRVEDRIDALEGSAALEAASNFEGSLRAHSEILARLAANEADDAAAIASLSAKVHSETNDVLRAKVKAEAELSAKTGPSIQAAAEGKLKAAENKIAEVKAFIELKKTSIGAEATAEAEANLRTAESVLAQGKAKLETSAYGDAFVLFQQAHQEAQEAKMLIELNAVINLDVRINL